eukprot:6320817-Prymnesium_polylepis.1
MPTQRSKPPTSKCEPEYDRLHVRMRASRLNVDTVAPDSMLITCTVSPEPTASREPSPEKETPPSRTD